MPSNSVVLLMTPSRAMPTGSLSMRGFGTGSLPTVLVPSPAPSGQGFFSANILPSVTAISRIGVSRSPGSMPKRDFRTAPSINVLATAASGMSPASTTRS